MTRLHARPHAGRWLLTVALALVGVVLVPGASAHAVPFESSPAPGERLDAPPDEIVVRFTEPVYEEATWIRVLDSGNERVDNDDLQFTHGPQPTLRITVPPDLPDGAYRIVWQTYSQTDGHTVGGAIGFAVGGFVPPGTQTAGEDDLQPVSSLGRGMQYGGYSLAFGAMGFRFFMAGRTMDRRDEADLDRAMLSGAGLATAGLVILALDTARQTGLGTAAYLASDGGQAMLVRTLAAAGVLAVTAAWTVAGLRTRPARGVLAVGWLAVVWLGARFGHANVNGVWATAVQSLHAVAAATWVGGLALLFWTLRGRDADAAWTRGRRFGDLALWTVIGLAGSGVVLWIAILGSDVLRPAAWLGSPWGLVLLAKVGVAAAMVGLAGVNRYVFLAIDDRLTGLGQRLRALGALVAGWRPLDGGGDVPPFRRFVALEGSFGVVVLVLAGFLMSLSVPYDGLSDEDAPLQDSAQGAVYLGSFRIDPHPRQSAFHTVRVFVQDEASGEPVRNNTCAEGRDDCLQLTWWPDAEGEAAAQDAVAEPEGDGWWRVEDVLFTASGNHTMVLRIQTAEVFEDELVITVPVAPEGEGR